MQKIILLTGSVSKTLVWTLWNTLFGLAPLVTIFFIRSYSKSNSWLTNEFIMNQVIEEGIIMFFCVALMSGVSIDFILSKIKLHKYLTAFIVILTMSSLICVSLIFSSLYFHPESEYDKQVLIDWQSFFIFLSGVFCLIFKTILFYKEG